MGKVLSTANFELKKNEKNEKGRAPAKPRIELPTKLPEIKDRVEASDEAASRFELAGEGDEEMTTIRKARSTPLRKNTRGERLVVYIPHDVAGELRMLCARERRSLSDAITASVRELLAASQQTAL